MVLFELLWSIQGGVSDSFDACLPDEVRPYLSVFREASRCYEEILGYLESATKNSFEAHSQKMYTVSFCEGVQELMDEFMTSMCDIEKNIYEDEDFSLINLLVLIDPIIGPLSAMADCVKVIQKKNLTGCLIIDLCNSYTMSGSPDVKRSFQTLTKHCMRPFFKQTKSWILRSDLFDPNSEYFFEIASNSSKESESIKFAESMRTTAMTSVDVSVKYSIDGTKLPKFLPFSIASKILFIGQTLLLFQRDSREDSEVVNKLLKECGLNEMQLVNQFKEIQKEDTFNQSKFDTVITSIYESVDKFAIQVTEQVGDLKNVLVKTRDIYLLGRGELFQEFLLRANHLLTDKPSHKILRTLKVIFKKSFSHVYKTKNLDFVESVYFTASPRKANSTMLDVLQINMKIRWPLDSLFAPVVVESFKRLFNFLLRLRRAQMDVLEVWTLKNINEGSEAVTLRNNLLSIVVNLQKYCFFNVIAKEIDDFMHTVDTTESFFAVQCALGQFLDNTSHKLFMSRAENKSRSKSDFNSQVFGHILNLFSICRQYSILTKTNALSQNESQIRLLNQKVNDSVGALIKLVQDADNSCGNSYLKNLILSLDYNRFFAK